MTTPLGVLALETAADVFSARQRVREASAALGFDTPDQSRIASALSEVGRLVIKAGARADVELTLTATTPPALELAIRPDRTLDLSPGDDLDGVREGLGMVAAQRLMDAVTVGDDGAITMSKRLDRTVPDPRVGAVRRQLTAATQPVVAADLRGHENRLLQTLEALQSRYDDLLHRNAELQDAVASATAMYAQLSAELEETNRGVVALYAELDERGEQLRAANTAKSRFLANVSHELRTPLNSINGLANLLREPDSDPLTPAQDNQVRLIAAATSELLTAVNGLLDLARAESGKVQPESGPVDVAALVADLRSTLRPLAAPAVELVVDVDADVGVVLSDGTLLAQLVRNLISNALKFTEVGEVRVIVTRDGDELTIAVRDTGIGIAAEDRDLVFEEFYRVPGHLQARGKSTGLGLPYARRVAEALGGALTVTSEPGKGSTFTATVHAPRPHTTAEPGTVGAVGTVLVGDDDAAHRELLRGLLTGLAEQVIDAVDADDVLATITERRPDVVLLDLSMPGGGGERVLAELAARPDLDGVKVVVVSSAIEILTDPASRNRAVAIIDKAGLDREVLAAAIAATGLGTRR
jgi:signal transduction histidine kinase